MSDTITVRGARADAYRSYRDVRQDIDKDAISAYRDVLLKQPERIDAETIAFVLRRHVKFADGARDVLQPVLGDDEAAIPYDQLRPLLMADASAQAVITACEQAKSTAVLAEALVLLFIEAHPRLVRVAELEELTPEDGADDTEGGDLPDEPPPGYGG